MKLPLLALLGTALFAVQTLTASVPTTNPYPNQYIITLKPETDKTSFDHALSDEVARENVQERSGVFVESSIARHYAISDSFKGYAGQFSPSLVAKLKRNGKVAAVELVGTIYASGSQSGAPWGLVRISERALDLTKPYTYPDSAGAGVDVYVVDTGIYTAHPDFGGRAKWGTTTCDGCIDKDENGHGTHVANLSLGGTFSAAVNNAVKAATSTGVVFVVAAGGGNTSACNTSPASEPSAVTVAATTKTDARASSSNYGTCIDIFAPGTAITSTWNNGGTNTLSGTSMASAHVAGVAAQLVGQNPNASVATIVAELIADSTPNVVQSAGTGSANKLAYVKQ